MLSAAVIIIQFVVDDRIRSAESIERKLHIPVLGMMPAAGQEVQERAQNGHEHTGRKSGGKGGQA